MSRSYLDRVSIEPPWVVGAAVLAIFVEGSIHERAEMNGTRELLEAKLVGEEAHADWIETQLTLIDQVGLELYLTTQVHE